MHPGPKLLASPVPPLNSPNTFCNSNACYSVNFYLMAENSKGGRKGDEIASASRRKFDSFVQILFLQELVKYY